MRLSALDLNLLVVLDAVLAERSVARAANRLHVTPSAVSNALARLRNTIGDPIVTRSGRGVVPTPRAAALAPTLARVLAELEQVVHGATFDPATTTRTFTLALADVGQLVRLPGLAALMETEMPHARLRVVGIDSLLSLGGLGGTEVDVVIGIDEPAPGVHMEPLTEERAVLVVRRDHPTARRSLSRAALARLRHVAVEMAPGRGLRDPVAQTFARAGITRSISVVAPTFAAAAAVVAATDLVAILPASLVDVLGERFGLRIVRTPVPIHRIMMYLRWHDRTHTDPAMVAFRDVVRRAGRPLASPQRTRD